MYGFQVIAAIGLVCYGVNNLWKNARDDHRFWTLEFWYTPGAGKRTPQDGTPGSKSIELKDTLLPDESFS